MPTTTRTHGRCAFEGCTAHDRSEVITTKSGRWYLIQGHVYAAQRRTFVVYSWAEACDEHRDAVAIAVRSDVDDWRDRWAVQIRTLDYGHPGNGLGEEFAKGCGTTDEHLF